jgi:ribosomal protein S18 acetylase RimI-like enzyme
VGCAGLSANGTVTRVYVDPAYRRRGGGRLLLEGLEASARALGLEQLRLDTREDLVEAQALYRAAGWVEVEPFNDDEYADRFFAKPLD